MTLNAGPLLWPLSPSSNPPNGVAAQDWTDAVSGAVGWLWASTARRFGVRDVAYRPQALACSRGYFDTINQFAPLWAPLWGRSWPFIGDPRDDRWVLDRVLELPGPAVAPDGSDYPLSVTLTDDTGTPVVLDPSAYRLDGDYLVRTDGAAWPVTQDLTANPGTANTWSVSYTRGIVPPPEGQRAAYLLAVEWVNMITNKNCKLPWNTSSVTRGGVSVQLAIAQAYRTSGVAFVDRWVNEVNPQALAEEPRVFTPDRPRQRAPYAGSNLPYRAGL